MTTTTATLALSPTKAGVFNLMAGAAKTVSVLDRDFLSARAAWDRNCSLYTGVIYTACDTRPGYRETMDDARAALDDARVKLAALVDEAIATGATHVSINNRLSAVLALERCEVAHDPTWEQCKGYETFLIGSRHYYGVWQ